MSETTQKTNRWYAQAVVRTEKTLNLLDQQSEEDFRAPYKKSKNRFLANAPAAEADFPRLAEIQIIRHFQRLARMNYSWDDGLYPLGSCTMKYNPVLNEKLASHPKLAKLHPQISQRKSQGAMQIIYEAQEMVRQLLDMHAVTLLPAAGAHGELIGVEMTRAYFEDKKQNRNTILIPDSAHGTNPASAAMAGYKVVKISSTPDGLTDLDDLRTKVSDDVALFMITNPSTMGIFEKNILEIKKILDEKGILLYMDGANLNAFVGKVSLEKMGVDLTQLNLHKTFSTPHGGGGPGQGALGCSARMADFLPSPYLVASEDKELSYRFITPHKTIGRMKGYYGQFGMMVRAWAYISAYGSSIHEVAENAVLNSTYLRVKLQDKLSLASPLHSLHEAVYSQKALEKKGLTTMNLAKALLDRGFYAPTVYFPLHVPGAIMIEPTETETKEELDLFIQAISEIIAEAEQDPANLKNSPHHTMVNHIDEVLAARNPVLTWRDATAG